MLDETTGVNLFNDVQEIWIKPELERRRKKGLLPDGFHLYAAQVITYTNKRDTEIRFNKEVKATLIGVASRTLHVNERISLEDGISEIKDIELSDDDDPNAAHLTIIKFKDKYAIGFDFRYNKKMAVNRLNAAEQFYESAKLNYEKGLMRPFAENLFAAAELSATAQLLITADSEYTKRQHHTGTMNRYSNFIDLGNYKIEYKDALLELKKLRRQARYVEQDFIFNEIDAKKYLRIIQEMVEVTKKLLS